MYYRTDEDIESEVGWTQVEQYTISGTGLALYGYLYFTLTDGVTDDTGWLKLSQIWKKPGEGDPFYVAPTLIPMAHIVAPGQHYSAYDAANITLDYISVTVSTPGNSDIRYVYELNDTGVRSADAVLAAGAKYTTLLALETAIKAAAAKKYLYVAVILYSNTFGVGTNPPIYTPTISDPVIYLA